MSLRLVPKPSDEQSTLGEDELRNIDAYWRAANYLSIGQIYLLDNPLLRRPLQASDIKARLLGHWGTTPGLNFVYAHMNRLITRYDVNAITITGPGHGGPGIVANTYLEGSYTELYPHITRDEAGLQALFKQFSFPGGISSHAGAETPGSINEGGELGYSLVHAYGAVFDNPDLLACCVVGDGEAETGALATSWHSNKFLDPVHDGAVLPILHLNGYKIAGPTVLARIPETELLELFRGYGYDPHVVAGTDPLQMHQLMARTMETVYGKIRAIQDDARQTRSAGRPCWPMIILRTPKGWTCPKEVDGVAIEGTWRAHQVPLDGVKNNPAHLQILQKWLESYRPQGLFDGNGTFAPNLANLAPRGERRMGLNPNANGGLLLRDLVMPNFRKYACDVPAPAQKTAESTHILGEFLRDIMRDNEATRNFRVMGPDETTSNRLNALFEVTNRTSMSHILPTDDHLAPDGRVMEVLSEHLCQGWLEGYLLTGRHGIFNCYEAFAHIIDSMVNQHAKWLKVCQHVAWRRPIASLNYLLSSHVWRQDHNGFSHQDPGFLDHIANKKAGIARLYLPPDANTLLSVADHCLRSRGYINVIVAGKQPELQYLTMDAAIAHTAAGIGIWDWAGNDTQTQTDVVFASAGDVPTLEALAAVDFLRAELPELKIRFVNVVDLMVLQTPDEHPHGLADAEYERIFRKDAPVIFAFHGYPALLHRLTYRRANHERLHVHGFQEEGTTTTPFDMVVRNKLDRFHLAANAISRLPQLGERAGAVQQRISKLLEEHESFTREHGDDMPLIKNWQWPSYQKAAHAATLS